MESIGKRVLYIGFILLGIGFSGSAAAAPMPVFVSILPQKYFVQQIGGDRVDVQVMVQPGASPATYEPKPRQMASIASATLYFAIGVPFESAWLEKIAAANPRMTIIHTDRGIEKRAMAAHAHEAEEDHHQYKGRHDGNDEAGILDPHIWLSPPLVAVQARIICAALKAADPDQAGAYTLRCERFIDDVAALDRDLRQMFSNMQGRRFMVFHPSWGYFAEAYGLIQVPIEMEGKAPKPAQLAQIITQARENHITAIFVQPQFSTKSAALVAKAIGGRMVPADPLAPDWSHNLKTVAAVFAAALR